MIVLHASSNTPENRILRAKVSLSLIWCFGTRTRMIFVDETGLSFNIQPRYGFSLQGQTPYAQSKSISQNYSIIMAMDNFGILGFMIFKESVKSEDYIAFLYKLVQEEISELNNKKVIFLMDNCICCFTLI